MSHEAFNAEPEVRQIFAKSGWEVTGQIERKPMKQYTWLGFVLTALSVFKLIQSGLSLNFVLNFTLTSDLVSLFKSFLCLYES